MLNESGRGEVEALAQLLCGSVSARHTDARGGDPTTVDPNALADEGVHEYHIRQLIEHHGYEPLGTGLGRLVYRAPATVGGDIVKFARPPAEEPGDPRRGVAQNKTEARVWTRVKRTDHERLFAPVYACPDHGQYLVTEHFSTDDVTEDDVNRLKQYLEETPYRPELNLTAVGSTDDGDPVCLDYGILNDRW